MCGIAGSYHNPPTQKNNKEIITRMIDIQKHRGPDDRGLYSDDKCVLGHCRLSIIDLSKDGHQPFESEDKRYQLIYNGEIYNYIELRDELKSCGWRFRTKTDTEVLLKAYQQFGKSCFEIIC